MMSGLMHTYKLRAICLSCTIGMFAWGNVLMSVRDIM